MLKHQSDVGELPQALTAVLGNSEGQAKDHIVAKAVLRRRALKQLLKARIAAGGFAKQTLDTGK